MRCSITTGASAASGPPPFANLRSIGPPPTVRPVARGALFVLSLFIIGMPGAEFIAQLDEGSFATHVIRTTNICSISDRRSASQSREQFATDLPPGEQKPAQTTIESVESIFA